MIVGFNFNKISVERKSALSGKIDISNNVAITDVDETEFSVGKAKQSGLKILFEFTSKYEPNVAEMIFTGELLYLGDPKKNSEIVKEWKKTKKLGPEITPLVINTLLQKCHTEALLMSRDVNLPPPILMPKVSAEI